MRRHLSSGRFALFFTLAIALTIGVFARGSAAAAVYIIHASTTATCDQTGSRVPADYQNGSFGSELHGFWDREPITVSFTFPDGRVFTASSADGRQQLLDGVVNMPPNMITVYQSDIAGDLYFDFPISNKWPYGCYSFNAFGVNSGQVATGSFVVAPRPGPLPDVGPARLAVWRNGTFETSGEHDSLVNIHGVNFRPNEIISVWITAPDGTVIDYPQQRTSDAGNFESTFSFTSAHPTGRYMFTALGTLSGYQVVAPFDLRSRSSVPSGWAKLRVSYPAAAATTQDDAIEIAGTLFQQGEYVGVWMTLPNGAVRGLPTQVADGNGDFYALIGLDERLPLGHYSVTASGLSSGRLVIASFDVGAPDGVFVGNSSAPDDSPEVIESNTGDGSLGGPTNTDGSENSPGPEITPPDSGSQGCNNPAALWTVNC